MGLHQRLLRRDLYLRRSEGTRLNSSHSQISYAVFCLKKKKKNMRILLRKQTKINHILQSSLRLIRKSRFFRPATPTILHITTPFGIFVFFFNDTATTEIYTLSLHDALPI